MLHPFLAICGCREFTVYIQQRQLIYFMTPVIFQVYQIEYVILRYLVAYKVFYCLQLFSQLNVCCQIKTNIYSKLSRRPVLIPLIPLVSRQTRMWHKKYFVCNSYCYATIIAKIKTNLLLLYPNILQYVYGYHIQFSFIVLFAIGKPNQNLRIFAYKNNI